MNVRYLLKKDIPKLKKIHEESGFDYPFPDFKEFMPVPVIVDEEDNPVMAVGCMPAVEVYFFCDPNWQTPGIRFEAIKFLHEFVRCQIKDAGVIEAHAFLPPSLEKSLGRKLKRTFGWTRSYWPCFSRRVD